MRPVLFHLSYSPWSEKARWALDHHHIAYTKLEHMPLVGEPLLRILSRELTTKQSVPRLFVGTRVFGDSLEIARFADTIGTGTKLFPEGRTADIVDWVSLSEELLRNGRARLIGRMLKSEPALREALPGPLRMLGGAGTFLARSATRFVQTHVKDQVDFDERERRMQRVLETLERAIDGRRYLLGEFTFADIAMASALGFVDVRPEAPLGPEQRKAWSEQSLASKFGDVLAWRDRTYASDR